MTSLQGSSLEPMEDRSPILSKLEDVKKLLIEIKDNTHNDSGNRSVFRHKGEQGKVIVDIRTSIISVGDIDTVSQQFNCDFYLSAKWKEPQLQGRRKKGIQWHDEWHPRIEFFNALEIKVMEKYLDLRYEQGKAIVVESFRIKGTFKQNFDFKDFPLDYQKLTITLMSNWTTEKVEFKKDLRMADRIRPETFTAGQEWYLCSHVVTESTSVERQKKGSDRDYPLYHIECHVKRKSGYYLWNIAMIIGLIYILSFCSFSVEISSPSERLSVTLTLLLTAVAFKFVVSESLPTISYDKYVLSGLVFVCCLAIENAVAASIPDPNAQKRFDRICLYIAFDCFLFIHVMAVAFVIKKLRTRDEELAKSKKRFREMEDQLEKYVKERQQKLTQKPAKDHETSEIQQKNIVTYV